MARRVFCVVTACAFLVIGQPAAAQTLGQAAAAARKAPPVDPAVRADIARLMDITGQSALGVQIATTVADAILNGMRQSQKDIPPRVIEIVREVFNTEFTKGLTSPEVIDKQVAIYAKYYTHADIKGLIAFYESDLGRKAIANTPHLIREGAAIGEEWAKASMPGMLKVLESRLRAEGLIP